MKLAHLTLLALAALHTLCHADVGAMAMADDGRRFFENKIRPVLVQHCYECHSVESGKHKGGLRLDSQQALLQGGDSGPAIIPGDSKQSLLIAAITHATPELAMPPHAPALKPDVVADFKQWISMGAPDPRVTARTSDLARPTSHADTHREHWSYRPLSRSPAPAAQDPSWARRELDTYVQAKLASHHLSPSADAAPTVLLRRVYFDVIGLPPTSQDVAQFLAQVGSRGLDTALASVVDRLLASPQFGERWGRHWLDVARYAESNGREANLTFPHAWRYRDYVIDAFNEDLPYDRFITEQLAGDLLPSTDDAARARLLIATGYLAIGGKGLGEFNKAQFAADVADEQLDATTRGILASSIACARCHDHKSDPFSMTDYYAMAGIFKSTQTYYGNWIDSENNNHGHLIRLPDLPGQIIPNPSVTTKRIQFLHGELSRMKREEAEDQEFSRQAKEAGKDLSGDYYRLLQRAIARYWTQGGIEGELERVDEMGRALPLAMGVKDAAAPVDSPLYERGELLQPRQNIPRGFPQLFTPPGTPLPPQHQSGRLELAQWLTHPQHPLTARVMANRVWRHLMGSGLVRTLDNFGPSGEPPSHPELLDHLAQKFIASHWSVKALVREVILSRTYRQSSAFREDYYHQDPDNRLLWRAHKKRLDAEVIRDAMLAVSGSLDLTRRRGSLVAELDQASVSLIGFNKKIPSDLDGSRHRSVYLPVLRDSLPDALEQFDVANPNLVSGERDVTNVPLQALYLMNGPFAQQQSEALAARILQSHQAPSACVEAAFLHCFNRLPDDREKEMAATFFRKVGSNHTQLQQQTLALFCQALFASGEFRYAD